MTGQRETTFNGTETSSELWVLFMAPTNVHIAVVLTAALAFAACSTTSEPENVNDQIPPEKTIEGSLSGDQIKALISGNTAYGQEKTYQWRTFYDSSGTIRGRRWNSSHEERDAGNWDVNEQNQLCHQWSRKWDNRKRACFEAYKDGELIKLINIDGNADSYQMMLVSGNKMEG